MLRLPYLAAIPETVHIVAGVVGDNGDKGVGVGEELGKEEVRDGPEVHGAPWHPEVGLDSEEERRHDEEVDEEVRAGNHGGELLKGVEIRLRREERSDEW